MSTVIDTRPTARRLRTPAYHEVAVEPSRTRGPSPTLAEFREAARRLFRGPLTDRGKRSDEVARDIRESRYPEGCVNILVDEAVCRGGQDGLELAAAVLARVPTPLLRVIESYFRKDSGRRRRDRVAPYPRYRAADEAWAVLLDALARTKPSAVSSPVVFATLRRVERSATDGMRSGVAAAVAELADRNPAERAWAVAFLRRMLGGPTGGRPPTATARGIIEGYLADLSD